MNPDANLPVNTKRSKTVTSVRLKQAVDGSKTAPNSGKAKLNSGFIPKEARTPTQNRKHITDTGKTSIQKFNVEKNSTPFKKSPGSSNTNSSNETRKVASPCPKRTTTENKPTKKIFETVTPSLARGTKTSNKSASNFAETQKSSRSEKNPAQSTKSTFGLKSAACCCKPDCSAGNRKNIQAESSIVKKKLTENVVRTPTPRPLQTTQSKTGKVSAGSSKTDAGHRKLIQVELSKKPKEKVTENVTPNSFEETRTSNNNASNCFYESQPANATVMEKYRNTTHVPSSSFLCPNLQDFSVQIEESFSTVIIVSPNQTSRTETQSRRVEIFNNVSANCSRIDEFAGYGKTMAPEDLNPTVGHVSNSLSPRSSLSLQIVTQTSRVETMTNVV